MKKFTAILVAIVLALFVVSCGSSSKSDETENDTDVNDEDAVDTGADSGADTGADSGEADSGEADSGEADSGEADSGEADSGEADSGAETTCNFKQLYTSDAKRYLAYSGAGKINDGNKPITTQQEFMNAMVDWANLELEGITYPKTTLEYGDEYSMMHTDEGQGYDNQGKLVKYDEITVEIMGDPNSAGSFTRIGIFSVPTDYAEMMKEAGEQVEKYKYELPIAPSAQILSIRYSSAKTADGEDSKYAMQCIVGYNAVGPVEEMSDDPEDEFRLGKTKICYDDNESFAVGETFKVSVLAELMTPKEMVYMFSDIDKAEDLCFCFDNDIEDDKTTLDVNESAVDCATIAEFKETDPCKPQFKPYPCSDRATCKKADNEAGYVCENEPCEPNPCAAELKKCVLADNEAGYVCKKDIVTLCKLTGGEFNFDTEKCVCGEGTVWDDNEGCKEDTPAPNQDEVLCNSTSGTWTEGACDCGEEKEWNATEGCKPVTVEEGCTSNEDCDEGQTCNAEHQCVAGGEGE